MGMRSVVVRVNRTTYDTVHSRMPKDLTYSAWIRQIVETLTDRPETNYRRRALQHLIESRHEGGRLLDKQEEQSGPCKRMFRCQAEPWAALDSLARAAGLARTTYFRRAMYMGSIYAIRWYGRYGKDEDETTEPEGLLRKFGPSSWPLHT